MKIKQHNNGSNRPREILDLLKDKKSLRTWFFRLAGLGLVVALFFGALGYGAYLRKTGDTGYYKHALLRIADLDFSFLKNYAQGQFAELDKFDVDIKFKHLLRIQYLREQALKEGIISEAIKSEEFPAKLTYNGKTYDVKIGLTGMMTVHLENAEKFSFEVKLKGDNTLMGMKRFGLLLPDTRGYLTDWLALELMKERGLMGLRVDFVDVSINGKAKGIFYMEERFDKYLVESNSLREGPIFKIEENIEAYQEKKLMAEPGTRDQLLMVKRMWQDVLAGNLPPEKFFDMEKLAKAFAITDLMNNRHALYRFNLRFYFNPVTGLAEPIVREWGALHKNEPFQMALMVEQARPGTQSFRLGRDRVLDVLYKNLEFKKHYIREANYLCQEQFLNQFLAKNGEKIHRVIKKVYMDWPFYDLPTNYLYENQKYMASKLAPDMDPLIAYFEKQEGNQLVLHLRNQQDLPLEVKRLNWRDTMFFYPKEPIVMDGGFTVPNDQVQLFRFEIPPTVTWSDTLLPELQVTYNLLGLEERGKSSLVFPWPYEEREAHVGNPIARDANHSSFKFIEEEPETGVITIPKGNWTVDRDLVIPGGRRLEVEPGATVDIRNDAKVICYSPVFFRGTAEEPILVHSSDTSSQGVLIIGASEERSLMEHTTFRFISRSKEFGWGVTGALVLYETPVDFRNVAFIGNREGDDFLNVIRADFTMDQVLFKDIKADAFDCDFCTGVVANSSFVNVGNDGIDVSGTRIRVSHVTMDGIGDKGLSAGEGSDMEAQYVSIANAEIALTSKDRSRLVISDSEVARSRIGFAIFEKKSEFGPAFVRADRVKIDGAELPYAIEKNSGFILDGANFPPNRDDVKAILYGAEFGKASVR